MSRLIFAYLSSLTIMCGFAMHAACALHPTQTNPVDAHFNPMDSNRDGKLSPEEHTSGAKTMFDRMDADKDGTVTSVEMDAAHPKVTPTKATRAEMSSVEKIKVIDANGDGELTAEEHAAGSRMMFNKMDTDRDGFVSKAELTAGHAKMLKKDGQ